MDVKFWGVRGSIPSPGPNTVKYGGNTSCVSIIPDGKEDIIVVLDGGSGLRELGIDLMKKKQFGKHGLNSLNFWMFFSHVHWDHIQGVPFFKPMFLHGNRIRMFGEKKVQTCLEETLKGQQQYPNFPISVEEISINGAEMSFTDLFPGQETKVSDCMTVSCTKLSHPDGVFCYKLTDANGSLVYATDTEHRNVLDPRLLKMAKDADVLVYDAQYTPDEYVGVGSIPKFDWGHSTYEFAVDTAVASNVKKLVLFHHEPEHTDQQIDEIAKKAEEYFVKKYCITKDGITGEANQIDIIAAYEGLHIKI